MSAEWDVLDSTTRRPYEEHHEQDHEEIKAPVFVDASGRRSRRLRRAGYAAGALCAGYGLMVVISLTGGPVSPQTLLPIPGVPERANGDEPVKVVPRQPGERGLSGTDAGPPVFPIPSGTAPVPQASGAAPAAGAGQPAPPPAGPAVPGQPAAPPNPGAPADPVTPPDDPADPPTDPGTPTDPATDPTTPGGPATPVEGEAQ